MYKIDNQKSVTTKKPSQKITTVQSRWADMPPSGPNGNRKKSKNNLCLPYGNLKSKITYGRK